MKAKIPTAIKKLIKDDIILSVIQFGSSTRKKKFNDIDLGIIIRKGCHEHLLNSVFDKSFPKYDISFIKEEEIKNLRKFRFGNQGMHFAYSLQKGNVLYGKNPFKDINISKAEIDNSIITRLYDYMYDVRKAITTGVISKNIRKRWPKFLRLSLYLIDPQLKYPDVLQIKDKDIPRHLEENKINIVESKNKKLLINYETVWEKVLLKNNII